MYSEKVKTLTLDKANIIFGITLGGSRMDIEISLNYLIHDWFYKLGNSGVYGPDYGCSGYFIQENKFNQRSVFKMTEKKIDKKVNETLKEQELDKVTGGQDDYPCKPKPEDEKPKRNIIRPW